MHKKCCKALYAVSALLALTLVAACDLEGKKTTDTPETPFEAPNMGSPSELVASGGAVPGSEVAAVQLFFEAVAALNQGMNDSMQPAVSVQSGRSMARATSTETYPISWQGPGPGDIGNVGVTGSVTSSFTFPDESWNPQPNRTYNDLIKLIMTIKYQGMITGVTVWGATPETFENSYNISGKITNDASLGMDVDLVTASVLENSTARMNFAYAQKAGFAFSIKRSDNIGAKFILSYAHKFSRSNIPAEQIFMGEEEEEGGDDPFSMFLGELITGLQESTATLRVYDDDDTLLLETTIPLSQIPGNDFSDFLF